MYSKILLIYNIIINKVTEGAVAGSAVAKGAVAGSAVAKGAVAKGGVMY